MPFVLDASAAAAWCFPDQRSDASLTALERLTEDEAIVPALWWFEIRNILVVNERRGRIDFSQSAEFLAEIARLPLRIDRDPESEIVLALARKHRLSAYGAAYLELARRLVAPLATFDRALAAAARTDAVPLVGDPGIAAD